MPITFSERLRFLMEQRKLCLSGLAAGVGVSRQTVYNWLEKDRITKKKLSNLSSYLKVSPEWLQYGGANLNDPAIEQIESGDEWSRARHKYVDSVVRREQQLRLALQAANLVIWEYRLISNSISWTGNTDAMFGLNSKLPTELPQLLKQIITPEQKELTDKFETLLYEGGSYHADFQMRNQDDNNHWYSSSVTQQVDQENRSIGLIGVLRDITTRIEREEKISESEQRFKELYEHVPVSVWEEDFSDIFYSLKQLKLKGIDDFSKYLSYNPDFVVECAQMVKIIDVNQATLDLHKAETKEQLLSNLTDIFTTDSYEAFKQELIAIWNRKNRLSIETVVKTLNGEARYVTLNWAVSPGYENNLSRVLITIVDITERYKAEQALIASEKHQRLLFELSPIGLALTRMDGKLVDVNPAYANIIGYSLNELLELSYWEITPEKYLDDEKRQLDNLNKTGSYGPYEKEYIHRDGSLVPVRLSGLLIKNGGEQYIWSSVEKIA